MSPDDVSRNDLMWLAGWLEGEGCFMSKRHSSGYSLQIRGSSDDYDVIERVGRLIGSTSISERIRFNGKTGYEASVNGRAALAWMNKLYPFMSARRKKAIEVAMEASTLNKSSHGILDYNKAKEIRKLLATTTLSHKEIGNMFGVGSGTVWHISKNNIWKAEVYE